MGNNDVWVGYDLIQNVLPLWLHSERTQDYFVLKKWTTEENTKRQKFKCGEHAHA
jgi:hypothetical protein